MLLLASTADKLQVVTAGTQPIACHASYSDSIGTVVSYGRKNTPIVTATTTDIAGSPTSGVARNVHTVTVVNNGTAPEVVTVQQTDGTQIVPAVSLTMPAGSSLVWANKAPWMFVAPNGARAIL